MNVIDLLKLADTAVTAMVLGGWVWREIKRSRQLRSSLEQWQRWYRDDISEALETMERQGESQSRQQDQMEAIIDQIGSD